MALLTTADVAHHEKRLLTPHVAMPVQLSSLIGREREVATVCELLCRDDIRLLTLTGAPGIGKTRLSLEVATSLDCRFLDGIYFVNLAPITDPDAVIPAIAAALGIRQIGDQSVEDNLSRYISGRELLLVLDNFEQVLAAGPMVANLLKVAPRLKVLATSRELLSLSGEHGFPVPPLSLPPVVGPQSEGTSLPIEYLGGYDAVQLFVQRARAYKPDFALCQENADTIATICRRLDGLPLAIELAAARVRHLSPQAIADRLRDRLALLTGGARDLPLRQQTLAATIEWSYSLLCEEEKRLFRRLAVFRGSRTLEAIEAVCNPDQRLGIEPLDGIALLLDKSLLQQATDNALRPYAPHYMMLETIQEYAKVKLEESGEAETLYGAHALYFTELAERADPELHGPEQVAWLDRLESEQENFLAALNWAYHNRLDLGLRLVGALNTYWNRRGYLSEGREWTSRIVSKVQETGAGSPVDDAIKASMARAHYTLGFIAFRQGNYPSAKTYIDESVQAYEELQATNDPAHITGLVEALNLLGIVSWRTEHLSVRRNLHERALKLAKQIGDTWNMARSLYQLGHVARLTGDYAVGRWLFEESLALFRASDDKFNIGLALLGIGLIAERQADYSAASHVLEQALEVFKELRDNWGISNALHCLGCAYTGLRNYDRARAAFEENLTNTGELGTTGDMAETLERLGRIAYFQGDYEGAHQLYKRSLSLYHELGDTIGIARGLMGLAGVTAVATPLTDRRTKGKDTSGDTTNPAPTAVAARLLGTVQALTETIGFRFEPEDQELFDGYISAASTRLGEQTFARLSAEGRAMTLDQATASALNLSLPEKSESGYTAPSQPQHQSTTPAQDELTRREREVATLVTKGKTNREIAADLVVSERTVEGHVNNILTKLGFRSRSQISAWSVERGLARLSN